MSNRHIRTGMIFIGVCVIIGLGLAFATMTRNSGAENKSAVQVGNSVDGAPAAVIASQTPSAQVPNPDFIVTDQLLAHKPQWEELGQGPTKVSFCEGAKGQISNGSSKILNLNVVPNESDAASGLGTVKSGATLQFDPGDVGVWNVTDATDGGPLFQYEVTTCEKAASSRPANEAASSDQKQGKCRLTVAGTRYIEGTCNYAVERGGSFEIWELGMSESADETGDGGRGYMAYVAASGNSADGGWNGSRDNPHTEIYLGTLTRHGACWSNSKAEICLWG